MIAQIISWFLAFAAVFVFGMVWGIEVGSKRGWHKGRRELLKEQQRIGAIHYDGQSGNTFRRIPGLDVLDVPPPKPAFFDQEAEA